MNTLTQCGFRDLKTVFLSWQSDTRAACNRSLIQSALDGAIKKIATIGEIETDLALDRDTMGIPGSPDIATTILQKIQKSYAYIADVTLVGQIEKHSGQLRYHCNPNVLIELGYAIRALDFSRIILVQNQFFGGVENLPFDIRARRVVGYFADPASDDRSPVRKNLENQLHGRLSEIVTVENDSTGLIAEEPIQEFKPKVVKERLQSLVANQPDNAAEQLREIVELMEKSDVGNVVYASILDPIVDQLRRSMLVPKEQLIDYCERIVSRLDSPRAYFNIGFLSPSVGKPYASIAGYMKAIEAGNNNPSLCYLNAGNRYRELNEERIAISFFEKSVKLNPKQSNAWIGAAQLHAQLGETEDAKRYYNGYLRWYEELSETNKSRYSVMADAAQEYLKS